MARRWQGGVTCTGAQTTWIMWYSEDSKQHFRRRVQRTERPYTLGWWPTRTISLGGRTFPWVVMLSASRMDLLIAGPGGPVL